MTDIKMASEANKPVVTPNTPAEKSGGTHKPADPAVVPTVAPATTK